MKGVALDICPDITFVDITHDIAPYDTFGGALELAASYKYFPPGTVFVVVIDPGVGSARRGIAAEAGPYRFVAPDNGVLTLALNEMPPVRVVELTNARYARPTVSRTFEGRDRFAPAAAWLARGTALAELGGPLAGWTQLSIPTPTVVAGRVHGQILRVDRFGNLVSNLDRRMVEDFAQGHGIDVAVGVRAVGSLVTTYSDVPLGSVCALFGSSEYLEVAVSGGSAAEQLGLARGATVALSRV
jgi:S-adenosylmethionine hydrolase